VAGEASHIEQLYGEEPPVLSDAAADPGDSEAVKGLGEGVSDADAQVWSSPADTQYDPIIFRKSHTLRKASVKAFQGLSDNVTIRL
jgi:hypothetical protein